MHTFYAVPDAVVNALLAAVISKSIDYFSEFVGIPFIISSASAAAAAKRSLFSANAAQQRHNVAFFHIDGAYQGGVAVPAGRRVSGNHENNTKQNQQQIQNTNAYRFFASTSALPAISTSHTAV